MSAARVKAKPEALRKAGLLRYVIYSGISHGDKVLYKYPVLCKVEGTAHTPLIRFVPVRGVEAEAMELLDRIVGIQVREDGV